MKSIPYREGSLFAVPLRNNGFTVGVVARMAKKGKIILAYFFGKKFETIPSFTEISIMRSTDAIKCLRIGDLGLINGEWLILGDMPSWSHKDWPVPTFIRQDELTGRAWRVIYSDADPSKLDKEESIPYDTKGLEESDLYGYGAVELVMTKLLG